MGEKYSSVVGWGQRKTFIFTLSIFLVLCAVMVIPFNRAPSFTFCPFKNITGVPCPSCGMGRGFLAIGELDITTALGFNLISPLVFLGAILTLVFLLYDLVFRTGNVKKFLREHRTGIIFVVAALTVLSWINNLFFNPHFL